jgi:hypothetical protein
MGNVVWRFLFQRRSEDGVQSIHERVFICIEKVTGKRGVYPLPIWLDWRKTHGRGNSLKRNVCDVR